MFPRFFTVRKDESANLLRRFARADTTGGALTLAPPFLVYPSDERKGPNGSRSLPAESFFDTAFHKFGHIARYKIVI